MEKINNILQYIVIAITTFISIIIIATYIGIINSLILAFFIFILLYLFNKNFNIAQVYSEKNNSIKRIIILAILLFIISFVIRFILVKLLEIIPKSDFSLLLNASKQLSLGKNELNNSSYFLTWAYQTGFILYQTIIIKIFNNSFALNVLDCIYSSISCVFIFLISNKLFKNRLSSFIVSLMYSIGFFCSAYCGVLANQHLFTMLILSSIYILIHNTEKTSFKKSIIIALILSIANIIRPEAIIYLLAIEVYMFLKINAINNKKKYLINMLIILTVYFLITQFASFTIKQSKINENGLNNNNMLWKFVCGLDYDSNGQYSKNAESIFDDHNKELEFIINNLKMPLNNYLNLFKNKITIFWHQNDYNWVLQHKEITLFNANINNLAFTNIVSKYDTILYFAILIFLLINLINIMVNKQFKKEELLLMLMIIFNFFVYLIIEVQPRYSYTVKILLYILSSGGISYIINLLHIRGKVKINKYEKND